jgi:ATP-dependent Clp protease ATP-binding subunit ClpC
MFERYSEDARKVIFYARYEASRLGATALETDHLWLGLLRQNKRLVKRLAPHVSAELIEQRITQPLGDTPRVSMTVDLPLSEPVQRALQLKPAERATQPMDESPIKVDDIILALLREDTTAC